jgi:hypothetical protein
MTASDHIDYLKTINQTFHDQIRSADQKAAYIFTFLIALVAWSPEMRKVFSWTGDVPFPSATWGLCLILVVALSTALVCVALVLLPRRRNGGVSLYWAAWPEAGERLEHAARRADPVSSPRNTPPTPATSRRSAASNTASSATPSAAWPWSSSATSLC